MKKLLSMFAIFVYMFTGSMAVHGFSMHDMNMGHDMGNTTHMMQDSHMMSDMDMGIVHDNDSGCECSNIKGINDNSKNDSESCIEKIKDISIVNQSIFQLSDKHNVIIDCNYHNFLSDSDLYDNHDVGYDENNFKDRKIRGFVDLYGIIVMLN